ncbi:MAG: ATP-binding protein [Deltaproteobacteria bacterium]|jgi:magnesium chelatase subunit D|nr:ATP-binding protein [Deltaproteobacteria bacterium]
MESFWPFSAVIGQEIMKQALLAVVVNPAIGGVLLTGEKGTAKSSLVRALNHLLPPLEVVVGCRWHCDPVRPSCPDCLKELRQKSRLPFLLKKAQLVELPLSATEDRLIGGLALEDALLLGQRTFQEGLLSRAHRGLLYVDEVNLLPDHLMSLILDAAASGVNRVQRDGLSLEHPARFSLIGSMNPEEGELHPQLLDRFGLCVLVNSEKDLARRLLILKNRDEFDNNRAACVKKYADQEARIGHQIIQAKKVLPEVRFPEKLLSKMTREVTAALCSGHRAEIAVYHTALTLAALADRHDVRVMDLELALFLALAHRRRESGPRHPEKPQDNKDNKTEENRSETSAEEESQTPPEKPKDNNLQSLEGRDNQAQAGSPDMSAENSENSPEIPPNNSLAEKVFEIGEPFKIKQLTFMKDRRSRSDNGRRVQTKTQSCQGRQIASRQSEDLTDLALEATILAAAPWQNVRDQSDLIINIKPMDYRQKIREKKTGSLLVFLVDASGSMGAAKRMEETKRAVFSLLLDAYQKRDKVAFIAFRGQEAKVLLEPTGSVERAYRALELLPTGGRTPLSAGLMKAREVSERHLRKYDQTKIVLIIISDCRANLALGSLSPLEEAFAEGRLIAQNKMINSLVIDVEVKGRLFFNYSEVLAQNLCSPCLTVANLKAETLVRAIRSEIYFK